MALTRIHFDTIVEVGTTIRKKKRAKVELVYIGENTYNIKAIDLSNQEIICNKKSSFPLLKGNSRKSFAKLRDFALNIIEDRPEHFYRESN